MNSIIETLFPIGGEIKQDNYIPPEITVMDIKLEQGFATSSESTSEGWNPINW